jgi:hypothetical protein
MKRNYKQILNDLPKDWSELKFEQYKKILDMGVAETDEVDDIFVGQMNSIKTISALTDIPVDELSELDYSIVIPMAKKIEFTLTMPEFNKKHSIIQWKKIDKVSYDDYAAYMMLTKNPEDYFKNIVPIIKSFSVNELTDEQINQMSMMEAFAGFFTLDRYVSKFIKNMLLRLMRKLVKQLITEFLIQPIKQKFLNKRNK